MKSTISLLTVGLCTFFSIGNVSADNEYMVESGDSLSKIGHLLGVPWEEIMKANNLKNTVIHPKQILIIPSAGKAYTNETPIKSQELVNNPPPSFVEPAPVQGPVPVRVVEPQQEAAPRTLAERPVPQRTSPSRSTAPSRSYSAGLYIPPIQGNTLSRANEKPEAPVTYMVRNGDTIWSISKNFGLTLRELQKANNMNTAKIHPGQVLEIPKKVVVAAN